MLGSLELNWNKVDQLSRKWNRKGDATQEEKEGQMPWSLFLPALYSPTSSSHWWNTAASQRMRESTAARGGQYPCPRHRANNPQLLNLEE